jgi:ribosomal protein S18 acetylase RimI-like enzyme
MSSSDKRTFVIREYRAADFPAICELDRECFSEAIAYTPQEIALGLTQPGAFAIVVEAEDGGEGVVAFVLAQEQRRKMGHIITIDVRQGFRRAGLGRKLMDLAEGRLRKRGVSRVLLEVSTANEPALRFYDERGYVRKRTLTAYYPDGSDAFLMEKGL